MNATATGAVIDRDTIVDLAIAAGKGGNGPLRDKLLEVAGGLDAAGRVVLPDDPSVAASRLAGPLGVGLRLVERRAGGEERERP